MKPGQIHVFDGLRLTTEHMNHLQGSFHSAVQDIREILGLGRVQTGFMVEKTAEQAITVQPGLAFDDERNRIICDEPQILDVQFEPGESEKYVCVKYEQVEDEDSVVEGQPTMIWDSCLILLRDVPPADEEHFITVAVLEWNPEQDTFDVVTQVLAEEKGEPQTTEGTGDQRVVETEAPGPEGLEWPVAQGVVRFGGEIAATALNTQLLVSLRMGNDTKHEEANGSLMLLNLDEEFVALDFAPVELSSQTILRAEISINGETLETGSPAVQKKVQSLSHGEAVFTNNAISQLCVSTIQTLSGLESQPPSELTLELSEAGIGQLLFTDRIGAEMALDGVDEFLKNLVLLIEIDRTWDRGFEVISKLIWIGGVHEGVIEIVERYPISLTWELSLAWKAMAEPYHIIKQ